MFGLLFEKKWNLVAPNTHSKPNLARKCQSFVIVTKYYSMALNERDEASMFMVQIILASHVETMFTCSNSSPSSTRNVESFSSVKDAVASTI